MALERSVRSWQAENRLPEPPLSFHGAQGELLCARQHVGVVEVQDVRIEIWPKLDAALLNADRLQPDERCRSVMANLLWMLDICGFMEMSEADAADLRDSPAGYIDVFAFLLGKNLLQQLEAGVARSYRDRQDDLGTVRGRIELIEQITRNWNRYDLIACSWSELSADIPLNRILKCACRALRDRVGSPAPVRILDACRLHLADVADLTVTEALALARDLRWDRANDRFRPSFEMAVRLLSGGYQLGAGQEFAFVALFDMNCVFEAFVGAALRARYGATVVEQEVIGHLLASPRKAIRQVPDYRWAVDGHTWVGDAKYKHLGKGREADPGEESAATGGVSHPVRLLSSADVRQLTLYAEIDRRRKALQSPPSAAVFYPLVGTAEVLPARAGTWNGGELWLVPVRVDRRGPLASCIGPVAVEAGDETSDRVAV